MMDFMEIGVFHRRRQISRNCHGREITRWSFCIQRVAYILRRTVTLRDMSWAPTILAADPQQCRPS